MANKRQLAAQATKAKIIQAAYEIMKESGFYTINVEDITQRAGVAKGTFYTYFKRKEDIVLELTRSPFAQIANELESMETLPLIERLTHYFHRFMECVEVAGIHICRQWTRDVLDPNNVSEDKDSKKWHYDAAMLKQIFDNAVARGELKAQTPTELLSYMLMTQLYGMMVVWCMSDGTFEPLDWTKRFCEAELEALLSPYIK